MLTLRESRTGTRVRVAPSRGGALVLGAGGPLVAYLLTDVIRRLAQSRGRPVMLDWADPKPANAADLTLLPPTGAVTPYDLAVGGPDPGPDRARHWLACPDVPIPAPPSPDWAAVRLSLLRLGGARAPRPAVLDAALIGESAALLAHWRRRVAAWAELPSRPVCADHVARFRAVLGDDLDTARAVDVLRDLDQDPDAPGGAKFETAVHLDQVLALDLPREIGRS